jgi:DNA-binding CsgD family transcriptional regulator
MFAKVLRMITRTANGYAFNQWEGIPMRLPDGRKLTPGEVRAAVCRVNGLNAGEASQELHCSKTNIHKYWQSIYFKLNCSDVVIAINKMIELGALQKTSLCLIICLLGNLFTPPALDEESQGQMPFRTRRNGTLTQTVRILPTIRVIARV